jgi:ABC-type uncharacterized transport system ATPase subunit
MEISALTTKNKEEKGDLLHMEIINHKTLEVITICDRALIDDIKLGVEIEQLPTQFTTAEIAEWMKANDVKNPDGSPYPPITHELLLNYSLHIPVTKKRKQKVLYASLNERVFSFNPF